MRPTLAVYGIQDISDNGFPELSHDHSLCLMQDGAIVRYLQLERHSRKKYDNHLHSVIEDLLKDAGLPRYSDIDLVFVDNVVGQSFISKNGLVRSEPAEYPLALPTTAVKGRGWWFGNEKDTWHVSHELAHIYSVVPFFGAIKDNSLLIHFDGGASKSNFSAWQFRDGKLNLIEAHWKLKYLSALYNANALNYFMLGVKRQEHNSLPGKYMGFSAYGTYRKDLEEWLRKNHFFETIWKQKAAFFEAVQRDFGIALHDFSTKNTFLQDIAATVQHIFTNDFLQIIGELQQKMHADYLYYSGGSALNIVTNRVLVDSGLFKEIMIPPVPSDSGLTIGAAALIEQQKGNQIKLHTPYLNDWQQNFSDYRVERAQVEIVAKAIMDNKVVATCMGKGEAGPRALGNRSILARANDKQLATYISQTMKGREWYRPLAPVALAKNMPYLANEKVHHLSRYMLLDYKVLSTAKPLLEGVIHTNGTARFQVVENEIQQPFLYALLSLLDNRFGMKALLNTSFNGRGEPIVQTCEQAKASALKLGIDMLIYQENDCLQILNLK